MQYMVGSYMIGPRQQTTHEMPDRQHISYIARTFTHTYTHTRLYAAPIKYPT